VWIPARSSCFTTFCMGIYTRSKCICSFSMRYTAGRDCIISFSMLPRLSARCSETLISFSMVSCPLCSRSIWNII
jgi:hypothetical protein